MVEWESHGKTDSQMGLSCDGMGAQAPMAEKVNVSLTCKQFIVFVSSIL